MITLKVNFDINRYFSRPAVYKIKFNTGHFYIGVTNDIKARFMCHRAFLKNKTSYLSRKALAVNATEAELILVKIYHSSVIKKKHHVRLEQDLIILNTKNQLMLNGRNSHLLKLDSL